MMRRAVFSELQRRGLERRFQIQKYISKPERKKLAEKLGLKDSQVGRPFSVSARLFSFDLIGLVPLCIQTYTHGPAFYPFFFFF